ncbi:MAG: LacI family DNA-binding transcriptional regulator [Caulobacterales bacterium]|nr:LacI family DNA-binding transcriptional regulator [Caulobacterales bacterium]
MQQSQKEEKIKPLENEEIILDAQTLKAIEDLLQNKNSPTINDVASISGVSKKTVSRIINNSENVKSETRALVSEIIKKIGFKPNPQARALAFRRSFLIGMIYDNPNAQYVVNMQLGVLDALRGTGNELVVHPCDRNAPNLVNEIEDFILMQRLSGIIILPPIAEDRQLLALLDRLDVPYVRISARDGAKYDPPIDSNQIVSVDKIGCEMAAVHLAQIGHKRIGFIRGNQIYPSAHERRAGFLAGLAKYSIEIDSEIDVAGDYSFESGYEAANIILSNKNRPSAIIASNDEMAAGVYKAAYEHGLKIPDDLSVVGFDDSPLAPRLTPALTTVRLPTRDMAKMAANIVLSPQSEVAKTILFDSNLILRNSTKAPQ